MTQEIGRPLRLCSAALVGAMASLLFGCGSSESINKSIMSAVNLYDGQPKPSASWQRDCDYIRITAANVAKYCWYQKGSDPKYTIWFLHGAGDSERVFESSPAEDASYVDFENRLSSANIVTVSYGPLWLLTIDRNPALKPDGATVDVFTSTIMQSIERRHRLARPYIAMGHSQGGANVATLCTARPDLWSKCALLNPMLPSCNPFNPWPVCFRWFNFGGLGPNYLVWANYSRSDWEKNQPRALLKKLKGRENPPKLFVTACRNDTFDLFDGAKDWVDEARQLGLNAESVYLEAECDHFHWPAYKVVDFLDRQ
jgi:pimeloyl-ACP methyl ester carboxylesterase